MKYPVSKAFKITSGKLNSVSWVRHVCTLRASYSAGCTSGARTWMIKVKLALLRLCLLLGGQHPVEAVLAQDRHLPLVVVDLVLAQQLHDLLAYWRLQTHIILRHMSQSIDKEGVGGWECAQGVKETILDCHTPQMSDNNVINNFSSVFTKYNLKKKLHWSSQGR